MTFLYQSFIKFNEPFQGRNEENAISLHFATPTDHIIGVAALGSFDLVVGVPRSGLLAGFFASLATGCPLTDPAGLRAGVILFPRQKIITISDKRLRVLVIDDSINSGSSIKEAREQLADLEHKYEFVFCAAYGDRNSPHANMILEHVPSPRFYEWNILHHDLLAAVTVDIDEVVLGAAGHAQPPRLFRVPTKRIGYGLTSLPEEEHANLRITLEEQGVNIGWIIGVNCERNADLARAKAEIYMRLPSFLYLVRSSSEAKVAAASSGKAVVSLDEQRLHRASPRSIRQMAAAMQARYLELQTVPSPLVSSWFWKHNARRVLGERVYLGLKTMKLSRSSVEAEGVEVEVGGVEVGGVEVGSVEVEGVSPRRSVDIRKRYGL